MKPADLDSLLEAARAADAVTEAPVRIEAELRAAYLQAHRSPALPSRPRGLGLRAARDWFWAGLAAAVAAVALFAVTRPPRIEEATVVAESEQDGDFTPLVYGDPWTDVEAVQVMRVEMPRTALAALGYVHAAPASDATAAVRADLLVGNDGIARGIRFVQ